MFLSPRNRRCQCKGSVGQTDIFCVDWDDGYFCQTGHLREFNSKMPFDNGSFAAFDRNSHNIWPDFRELFYNLV